MKFKILICGLLIFRFTMGSIAPSQMIDSTRVNTDSLLIEYAARLYVDSIQVKQEKEIDSLAIVIDSLKKERGKKLIIGQVDKWRDADGRLHIWEWWYWRFSNGQRIFYKARKKSIK